MISFVKLATIFLLMHSFHFFPGSDAICPDRAIPLCLCKNPSTGNPDWMVGSVECVDSKLTSQDQVEELFRLLREANGLSLTDRLTIETLFLRFEPSVTLDLSPFLYSTIKLLDLTQNAGLRLIGPNDVNGSDFGRIDVFELDLSGNFLTPDRLGQALSYFSSNMSRLHLRDNQFVGKNLTVLPGLSALNQLELLDLDVNRNPMENYPPDFFMFQPAPPKFQTIPLRISLGSNLLHAKSIPQDSGLERLDRPLVLNLENNFLRTLPELVFRPIILGSNNNDSLERGNVIILGRNRINCDVRVKWLTRLPAELQRRVEGAECINDPGQNVFNSTAVNHRFEYGGGAECPDPALIAPCTCDIFVDEEQMIGCRGSNVTQPALRRVLEILRNASSVTVAPEDALPITLFELIAPASSLNLSLFTRVRSYSFVLEVEKTVGSSNGRVMKGGEEVTLVGPTSQEEGLVHAKRLILGGSGWTDKGLGSTLKFFSPEMTELFLFVNRLKGPDSKSGEFLPGLSALVNLTRISLRQNPIEELSGGPFQKNVRLEELVLNRNKKLRVIGPDAFLFDPSPDSLNNTRLLIRMQECDLTDTSFADDSGLERIRGRPVNLELQRNQLGTLPMSVFGPFLRAHPKNMLFLDKNPLECDDRLAWLQNGRMEFQHRVLSAMCRNDPEKSIFDSELVQKRAPLKCPIGIPCTCKSSGEIECSNRLSQDQIQGALRAIQEANVNPNVVPSGSGGPFNQLWLSKFRITESILRVLNLAPFAGLRIDRFEIEENPKLEQIASSRVRTTATVQKISASHLAITDNRILTDANLGPSLLQFSSDDMVTLDLSGNSLTLASTSTKGPSSFMGEFLPSLATLKNLQVLSLANNKIQRLLPLQFQFQHIGKLEILDLTGNQITDIPANSFVFFKPIENVTRSIVTETNRNRTLNIRLASNLLTANSLDPNSGLERVGRRVHLDLRNNNITTLPEIPFVAYLKAHPGNSVDLKGNPIICDEKVDWAAGQKAEFFSVVQNAECANFPGQTIFNFKSPNIFAIALGVILVAVAIITIVVLVFQFKYRQIKAEIRDLTSEEIKEFQLGASDLDPNNPHSDIYGRPYNSHWEIPIKNIEIDKNKVLGSGQFGVVYSGFLTRPDTNPDHYAEEPEKLKIGEPGEKRRMVAIKTVKRTVDVETFKALLAEIKIMCHLETHPNVISLIGVSTHNIQKREAFVVVEFCAEGDLQSYLVKHRADFVDLYQAAPRPPGYGNERPVDAGNGVLYENDLEMTQYPDPGQRFSTLELVSFALGVANGMSHLTAKNVIHADLACRNVLLTERLEVKISDFGLSRQLHNYTTYTKKSQTPLPFRWMSIEALKDRNFSIKSDVWSFGVTLWEMFSLGEIPYPDASWDVNFVTNLKNGHRLPQPEFADKQLYELMLNCWKTEPGDRPSFNQIRDSLMMNSVWN